jgi:hypothetical protein
MGVKRFQLRRRTTSGKDKILAEVAKIETLYSNPTYEKDMYKGEDYFICAVDVSVNGAKKIEGTEQRFRK